MGLSSWIRQIACNELKGITLVSTHRMPRKRVRDVLRRLFGDPRTTQRPTRISTAHWRRSHTVVHPERDLSEWVHDVMDKDWDNVRKGKNNGR